MNNKYRYDYTLNSFIDEQRENYLTEEDFYPPQDNRYWKSYVEDINGGDNFADYCRYIFKVCEEEGYYDS